MVLALLLGSVGAGGEVYGALPGTNRLGGPMMADQGGRLAQSQSSQPQTQPLMVVYPPATHTTTSDRIFFIGSGDPSLPVLVGLEGSGDAPVAVHQSPMGNFAPSFPLQMGENRFLLRQGDRTVTRVVTRRSPLAAPAEHGWVEGQVFPQGDLGRLPQEQLCFRGVGAADLSQPRVEFDQGPVPLTIPLLPQRTVALLPDNKAALVDQTDPGEDSGRLYGGCLTLPGLLPTAAYGAGELRQGNQRLPIGRLELLDPDRLPMVEVTALAGVARTGPSTNHSRLTPLPQGTRATVTGYDGEWLRLKYGGWIRRRETRPIANGVSLPARLRSVTSRPPRGSENSAPLQDATEIRFPLDRTVPISVAQGDRHLTLTLHHTIAETDIVAVSRDRTVKRVTWEHVTPETLQFRVDLRGRAWGYQVRYDANTLVLRLKHPPQLTGGTRQPLRGATILIDPGHGGEERGAIGPTGYPEKDANLAVSLALRSALEAAGATVVMTRETDRFVSLGDRQALIAATEPTMALSIHFNALPDSGSPETTAGIGMFWYHPQAQALSEHLQATLTAGLDRPTYGVFWNNLALARPSAGPSVLLELGFMTHPEEFEWIRDPDTPSAIATVLTQAIVQWITQPSPAGY
ncbi:MAG: N-acetylmuramoyl-L-alanine amidase [Cyanobacteria bacterium P01_H01_bin.130]